MSNDDCRSVNNQTMCLAGLQCTCSSMPPGLVPTDLLSSCDTKGLHGIQHLSIAGLLRLHQQSLYVKPGLSWSEHTLHLIAFLCVWHV